MALEVKRLNDAEGREYGEVVIGENRFRIGQVTAKVGNWILIQRGQGRLGEEDVYEKIVNYLFSKCQMYQNDVPMAIYGDGRWLKKNLENDLETVNGLFIAAMDFNFTPFFQKRRKEAEEDQAKKDLNASQPTIQ